MMDSEASTSNPRHRYRNPNIEHLPVCEEREVAKALKQYQANFHLRPTGHLDEETKTLMSSTRCGNKDNEEEVLTSTPMPESEGGFVISSPAAPRHELVDKKHFLGRPKRRHNHKKHNKRLHHHHRREDKKDNESVERSPSSSSSFSQQLTQAAGVRGEPVLSSRTRRSLDKYLKSLKRPLSKEEREELIKPYHRKRRAAQPRSYKSYLQTNLTENREGKEADNKNNQMLENNGKNVPQTIKWRILRLAYSTRIDEDEQRDTFRLAFRMWSEVIPVIFEEDTDGYLALVNITIAFGRGQYMEFYSGFCLFSCSFV